MSIVTCPTDLVGAPADRIWDLLTLPAELELWSGTRVVDGPRRRLAAGDDLHLGAGIAYRFRVRFHFVRTESPQELALEIFLPFGVVNHEVVQITPAGTHACRVTFN